MESNTSYGGFRIPNFTRLSKVIAGILGFFLFIGLVFPSSAEYLTINAAYIVPPYFFLWTFFTAGLFDTKIISGIINIIILLFSGQYLEPIWGSQEFLKFIAVVNFFSGLFTFIFYLFGYILIGNENFLYRTYVCGFSGIILAFSVALKQLIPEQEFQFFFITLRIKYLASLLVLLNILFSLLGIQSRSLPFVLFGFLISWVYLRFYQKKGGVRGDLNESFSFATFFPDPIQQPVKVLSNIVYQILLKIRLCPVGDSSILPTTTSNSNNNLSYNSADIDRRRALAMKALEQRMQQNQQTTQQPKNDDLPIDDTNN
ncbi:hypothetical protein CYY_007753 [Polysphondylium violaceum]|uniref:Transmembrane protein n=1 Tax=Polysphondylium violaceum TaxID=133409 RepID=A0A8J4PP77_9MYCE|nr:hypothetical protein CYY_007753 [Polysphondylium violaceum]